MHKQQGNMKEIVNHNELLTLQCTLLICYDNGVIQS